MPIAADCRVDSTARIPYPDLVNLYGCTLGPNVFVGPFVEIQKNVSIGQSSRIQSHAFICEGVQIGERVFVGHGVIFINDRHPRANNESWTLEPTCVEADVSIGSGAIIMCGVRLQQGAQIGAGAVVIRDVGANECVVGLPARAIK